MYVHPDVPELNWLLALFVLYSKFPPVGGSAGTLFDLKPPASAPTSSNKDATKQLSKILSNHIKEIFNDPEEKDTFVTDIAPGSSSLQFGIHSAKSSSVTHIATDINGPNPLAICFRSGAAVKIESLPAYIRSVPGADQKCKTLSGYQEMGDMNKLPPHFGKGGAFIEGVEGGWASMFPSWDEYDEKFRSIFPLMMASAVHHREFLEDNLDPSHYVFDTPAWREVTDTAATLDAEWLEDNTKSSWMRATGVDATNTLHIEVRDLKDAVADLTGLLEQSLKDKSSGHPPSTATSAPVSENEAALTLKVQQLEAELARQRSSPSSGATGLTGPPTVALVHRSPVGRSTCPPHAAFMSSTDNLVMLAIGGGMGVQPLDDGRCTCTLAPGLSEKDMVKKKNANTKDLGKQRSALSNVKAFVVASAEARSKPLETDADVKQVLVDLDGFRRAALGAVGINLKQRGGAFTTGAITTAQKSVKGIIKQSASRWGPCTAFRHAFLAKALNVTNPVWGGTVIGTSCACTKCKNRTPGPPPS